jgi:hypothetical protein
MELVDMLQEYPHPNIGKVLKKTTFGAQPSLVLEKYDGDIYELDRKTKEGQRDYIVALVLEQCRSPLSVHPYRRRTHLKISLSH